MWAFGTTVKRDSFIKSHAPIFIIVMNTEDVKRQIKELVDNYTKLAEEKKISKYTEETTKKDFILPLFEALGWNVYNKPNKNDNVSAEETIAKKRVDYVFRINGIPQFLLEAKAIPVDLNKTKYAEQAINYSWHKGCTWAVLTDFEGIKVFNAEWKSKNVSENLFLDLNWSNYLDYFDDLWLLSKDSFEKGLLDKKAERYGKKSKKISVDKQLLADFTRFREMLSKDITKLNQDKGLTEEELDESVQRILDRLIFIRNCEDRELEARKLMPAVREWESQGRKGQLLKQLRAIFNYFDDQYNSKLFQEHLCDSLEISDNVLNEVVYGLYQTKDQAVYYDFSAIEADVLGTIYEQYLGHILRKTAKRAKVTESHVRRKEHGIYYTPPYIVDYIVRNTLGDLLKRKRPKDVEKIRVLDPACGSGSFLIKSFDILNEYWKDKDKDYAQAQLDTTGQGTTFTRKVKVLQNNIFGVDLDKQAVEIAQLNLLLKIAEKGHRLPLLQQNIKCGNSLIDDPNIAGNKAFNWDDEFKEIMGEGRFDIVIGNPPWISIKGKHRSIDLSEEELRYFFNMYKCNTYMPNFYELFIWRSLSLLKEGGLFSFIVPDRLCTNQQFIKLREHILENFSIKKLWLKVPFPGIIADTVIFVIEKTKSVNNVVDIAEYPNTNFIKTPQKVFRISTDKVFFYVRKEIYDIFDKIESRKNITTLDKIALTTSGCGAKISEITVERENNEQIPILKGESIYRNQLRNRFWFEFVEENLTGRTRDERKLGKKLKVLLRKTGSDLIATFDESGIYPEQSLYFAYTEKDDERNILLFISAILNSKLMNCYYRNFAVTNRDSTPQLKKVDLDRFPIVLPTDTQPFIKLVDKMLSLNKRLNELRDKKTDERARIEEEINKADKEIDELVYTLYGITEEEKEIIEESLK